MNSFLSLYLRLRVVRQHQKRGRANTRDSIDFFTNSQVGSDNKCVHFTYLRSTTMTLLSIKRLFSEGRIGPAEQPFPAPAIAELHQDHVRAGIRLASAAHTHE